MLVKRIVAVGLVTLAAVAPSQGQSFGRNKVRYENFKFQVLETPHFAIYYDAAGHDAAVQAGRLAERWYARLSQAFDHTFIDRQPVVLYASHAQFTQTNVIPQMLGDGIGGVTEHEKGRVVMPFTASLGETDHVLGHELVHAFQRDILQRNGRSMAALPLWFIEGMAEYLSVGRVDTNTAMWLRDSVADNKLPRLDQLDDPSWFPYRYGQALWAYLAGRFGDTVVARSLMSKASGGAIGRIVAVTGVDAKTLSSEWHEFTRQSFASPHDAAAETSPDAAASLGATASSPATIVSGKKNGTRLNVGPTLSPDGEAIAFFSDHDRHSVDMVVADARTGAIRRKVVKTDTDPHFESVQFIESAGAWDGEGRRLAMAALSGGEPVLTILNVANGSVDRELAVRGVDQIFSPTWSPDGRRIAFSALRNGFSDLYVVDLDTGTVRQLMSDAFADLQPSWSPDGRTIAFSTDRFTSSIETLTFGDFRLASIDVASGAISELPSVANAKNIDPHWTPDGSSLYFVSDADGISNVYRVSLADQQIFKVTDVSTGVSGISALSPAVTVAARANQLAFSVYQHGAFEIRIIEAEGGTRVLPTTAVSEPTTTAVSEPTTTAVSEPTTTAVSESAPVAVAPASAAAQDRPMGGAVRPPTFGLQDGSQFTSRPYRGRLSLTRVVQPYLSAGGGGSGSSVRAGAGLSFGDMLGDHQLQTAFQVGKTAADFAAQAVYLNMRSRWNWGIVGGLVPWQTSTTRSRGTIGTGTVVREATRLLQTYRDISGAVVYPFSSAKRLELSGGLQSITFDSRTITSEYSGLTGRLLTTTTAANAARPGLLLGESRAALVYDTAVFGPTSPILGRRSRFAVSPTFGGLTYTTVTADYRQYWMPLRPLTLAVRVMHLGRYGGDANDPRLLPLVWTMRDLVRGFGDTGPGRAPLGSLGASRMFVANSEVRLPIWGLFSKQSHAAPLPIEALVFSDFGRFFTGAQPTASTTLLRSAGVGARFNAAGMIFELDAVHRFDVSRGWTFSFNLRPGF